MPDRLVIPLIVIFLFGMEWGTAELRADVIRLKNGGEIRGTMDRQKASRENTPLDIVSLSGIQMRIAREDVEFFVFRSSRVEEYETRERQAFDSAEDHWDLVMWCVRNQLEKQKQHHLEQVVRLSPNHERARKMLDHVKHRGDWMPQEEMMSRKGYVKHQNRYITMQEMALISAKEEQQEVNQEWFDQMKRWKAALYSKTQDDSQAALTELQALRDPDAVPALVKIFAFHPDQAARVLMLDILDAIDAPDAKAAIARQALFDDSSQLRNQALGFIPNSYRFQANQLYLEHLSHSDNKIVNRAARGLEEIGTEESIPHLVDALITSHTYIVQVPYREGVTFAANGSNNGQLGSGVLPAEIELLARTGQLPFGVQINEPLGIPSQAGVKWKPVKVHRNLKNSTVLATLTKLTEEDFGYDQRSWRLWMAAQKNHGRSLFTADPAS
ncbi:MAG: hypothetical protein P8M30_12785 [Planctomycetaceae bacterium]|jgi:hypothetical protein|nr:hypothetical protein [bacterium]MDC0273796.1 hypothetical protein [Planctomycetaceae bacterium]MDG2390185.1 hypothetical protein [Planctomycetaceae bacterium]